MGILRELNQMLKNELINFQDKLFLLKRILKEDQNPNIDAWKEVLNADTVLKRDGQLYFLEVIEEVEIIEEYKVN